MNSSTYAALLISLSAFSSTAQIQITAARDSSGDVTLTFRLAFQPGKHLSTITGHALSAIDSLEQTLGDGTHVTIKSDPIYRDSKGRTRTEARQFLPETGKYFDYVEIVDPVEGLEYVLDPTHDVAYRIHVTVAARASVAARPCLAGKPSTGTVQRDIVSLNEDLGSRIIDGVTVCGHRITLTYPIGSLFGNDRPVSTVSEDWTAWDEIGKIVYSSRTMPGTGVFIGALKNLKLEDPDPSLFRPPAGYRVVDENAEFTALMETAKAAKQKPRNVTALTGMPFTAESVLSTEQTLDDGTKLVHQSSSTKHFRDVAGRTRVDRGTAGIEIVDPVAGYIYQVDLEKKLAVRTPIKVKFSLAQAASMPEKRGFQEGLGVQTIDGMTTYGIRTTITSAAGSFGTDRPTKSVDERWRSPQLGIDMMTKMWTPTTPDLSTRIKNLQFGEPDPALFRVPEGYRIEDDPAFVQR